MNLDIVIARLQDWRRKEGIAPSALALAAGLGINTLRDMDSESWSPSAGTIRRLERLISNAPASPKSRKVA
jgi:transcriptional regulator with XRE-family HTH domain